MLNSYDRYEADESSAKIPPSEEIPAEPAAPSVPQAVAEQHDEKPEEPPEPIPEPVDHDQDNYEQMNGDGAMGWNGSNGNFNNNYGEVGEQESHGIGIKEDG